jgi:hypothetical protein
MNKIATFFRASRATAGALTGAPHIGQNLMWSSIEAWQVAHVIGEGLDIADPRDASSDHSLSKPPEAARTRSGAASRYTAGAHGAPC